MRRALAVPALCLATVLAGCANTGWVLQEPGREYSEGNYVWGTFMLVCLPVMVPIFMVADAFALLNVSEQDVAVVAQAGQDYVTAKAAQDQANAQAQAQALAAMQQQQQQQRAWSPQPAPQQVAMQTPAPPPGSPAYDEHGERSRQQVVASNAAAQAEAERLRQQNRQFQAQHANASNCLSLVPMSASLYGGFINNCAFKVNVTWCNDGATGQGLGNFSDAIDCRKNSFSAVTVAANGRVTAHTNAPRVYWMACKSPYTPVQGKFTGNGVVAVCKD
jgi:hypothetical protein